MRSIVVDAFRNVVLGDQNLGVALDPAASAGFVYIPDVSAAPTGAPPPYPGYRPIVYDPVNTTLWLYSAASSRWISVGGGLIQGANGQQWIRGSAQENIILSTSGTTTDSAGDLLPANSVIRAVVAYITTTIATATDWALGDANVATRFRAADTNLTAGTTGVGLKHVDQSGTSGPIQTAAAKLRITTTGTPSAGRIRVVTFYETFVPPTS